MSLRQEEKLGKLKFPIYGTNSRRLPEKNPFIFILKPEERLALLLSAEMPPFRGQREIVPMATGSSHFADKKEDNITSIHFMSTPPLEAQLGP